MRRWPAPAPICGCSASPPAAVTWRSRRSPRIRLGEAAQPRLALARFFAENFAVQAGGLERTVVEGAPGLLGADAALA